MSEDRDVTRPVRNFHDNCTELRRIWFISAIATFTLSTCDEGMLKFFSRSLLTRGAVTVAAGHLVKLGLILV